MRERALGCDGALVRRGICLNPTRARVMPTSKFTRSFHRSGFLGGAPCEQQVLLWSGAALVLAAAMSIVPLQVAGAQTPSTSVLVP